MKLVMFFGLIAVAIAATHKREDVNCHLSPGDRVVMNGTIIEKTGTVAQSTPMLIRQSTYDGGNNVGIEVTVVAGGGFQVHVNGRDYGIIPFIEGPPPQYVTTTHDINTNTLDVFSMCAANPARIPTPRRTTPSRIQTTAPSPEVRAAQEAVVKAEAELQDAINAQARAKITASTATAAAGAAKTKADSTIALNNQAIAVIQNLRSAADAASVAAENAQNALDVAYDAARRAVAHANSARDAAIAAARRTPNAANNAVRDRAIAAAKKAKEAFDKADAESRAILDIVLDAAGGVDSIDVSLRFARDSARMAMESANKISEDATKAALDAAAAVVAADNLVAARKRAKTEAEAALLAARG